MQTRLTLAFADGEYEFHLGLEQINELQVKCGVGIGAIYARVLRGMYLLDGAFAGNPLEGDYRIEDLVNIIRQGLIGGGKGVADGQEVKVTAHRANQLIEAYVTAEGSLLHEVWTLAAAIMRARMQGYEPKKKAEHPKETDGSTTPPPSPSAAKKASSQAKPAG